MPPADALNQKEQTARLGGLLFLVRLKGKRLALLAARAPPSARSALSLDLAGCRSVEPWVLANRTSKKEKHPCGCFLIWCA